MLCWGARCRVGPLAGRRALTPRRQDSKPMPRWVVQNAKGGMGSGRCLLAKVQDGSLANYSIAGI